MPVCNILYDKRTQPKNYAEFVASLVKQVGSPVTKILFKDDEGDDVTITCDMELNEAFSSTSSGFLDLTVHSQDSTSALPQCPQVPKIEEKTLPCPSIENQEKASPLGFVFGSEYRKQPSEIPSPVTPSKVIHPACCDHCGTDITGIRYKCVNCRDYDLCEICEASHQKSGDLHTITHVFLKISRPILDFKFSPLPLLCEAKLGVVNDSVEDNQISAPLTKCPIVLRLENAEKQLEELKSYLNPPQGFCPQTVEARDNRRLALQQKKRRNKNFDKRKS